MTRQTQIVIRDLKKFVGVTVKRIVVSVTDDLHDTTPVDTGWAQTNWIPNMNSRLDSPAGTRESVGLSTSAQEIAVARIIGAYRYPRDVHIANNVPYIGDLNDGTSMQAPRGFVQTAIAGAIARAIRSVL